MCVVYVTMDANMASVDFAVAKAEVMVLYTHVALCTFMGVDSCITASYSAHPTHVFAPQT